MKIDRTLPVLVVDDFSSVTKVVSCVLQHIGFREVDAVHTGAEALAKVQSKRYGLIVSDLHMKPMDGAELLWHLKSHVYTSSIPVIVLTGDPLESSQQAARQSGGSSFVLKAPSPGMLEARLEEAIAKLSAGHSEMALSAFH
jgi:two-component system chemotaxis response regulator CheY